MRESKHRIRQAVLDDLTTVASLSSQWADENLTKGYGADTAENLSERLGEFFLVAEVGGQVVGFVIGENKPTAGDSFVRGKLDDEPSYLEVQDLYVSRGHRNGGVGTALVKELLAIAAKSGVRNSLVYSTNRDYRRVAAFYEKIGYEMWVIHMTRKG